MALIVSLALTAWAPAVDGPASDADSRTETSAVEIAPSIFAENTNEVFEEGTKVTAVVKSCQSELISVAIGMAFSIAE